MAKKNNYINHEQVKEYAQRLENGIREIFESGKFEDYLKSMSKLHQYSFNNVVLIYLQNKNASLVAGYNTWEREFERHVKKGAKAIKIFAPAPYATYKEMEKIDPDTQMPVIGSDGNPVTENVKVTIPAFKLVNVFDVSQTHGKPLPQISENLEGSVAQYDLLRQAIEQTTPYSVTYEDIKGNMDGYARHSDSSIHIKEGMSQPQTILTLIHERSHAELYLKAEREKGTTENTNENRTEKRQRGEVEAEGIGYVVCQHFGIETAENSFGYIAGWSKDKELKELQSSLNTITETAKKMIDSIEERFTEFKKEHGIEQTVIEAEAVRIIPSEKSARAFAEDYYNHISIFQEITNLKSLSEENRDFFIDGAVNVIIDGSGIEDIRDNLKRSYVEPEKLGVQDKAEADELAKSINQKTDTFLKRLKGFEKMEYIMPDTVVAEGKTSDTPEKRLIGQNDFYVDTIDRHIGLHLDGGYITEAEEKILLDNIGSINKKMYEIAEEYEGGLPLNVETDSIDLIFAKVLAPSRGKSIQEQSDQIEGIIQDYANDYAAVMKSYYQKHPPKSILDSMDINPDIISNQIRSNLTTYLRQTIDMISNDPEFTQTASRMRDELISIIHIHAEPVSKETVQEQPDPTITAEQRNEYGYTYDGMLPLNKDRALELYENDCEVYLLHEDDTESAAFDREEIENFDGIFGIERDVWEKAAKQAAGKTPELDEIGIMHQRINKLYNTSDSTYGIYQIEDIEKVNYAFRSFNEAVNEINRDDYKLMYAAPLSAGITPERIYNVHNRDDRPDGDKMRSMSVSDVLVIKYGEAVKTLYVDSFGFREITGFIEDETIREVKETISSDKVEITACMKSNYNEMMAFLDKENNVYLGYFKNFDVKDNSYNNADGSLMFISDNKKMYTFLTNSDFPDPQEVMLLYGVCTETDFAEFAALKEGVLSQFTATKEITFDGQPFHHPAHAPSLEELEAEVKAGNAISLSDLANAVKNNPKNTISKKKAKGSVLKKIEENKKMIAQGKDPVKDLAKDTTKNKTGMAVD